MQPTLNTWLKFLLHSIVSRFNAGFIRHVFIEVLLLTSKESYLEKDFRCLSTYILFFKGFMHLETWRTTSTSYVNYIICELRHFWKCPQNFINLVASSSLFSIVLVLTLDQHLPL